MSPGLPGHSATTVGFEVPLEMLSACHRRVEQQCSTLRRHVPHLAAHGNDNALKQEVATMGNAQLLQKPAQEQTLLAALSGVLRWARR